MTEITDEDIKAEAIANLNSQISKLKQDMKDADIEYNNTMERLRVDFNALYKDLTEVENGKKER